MIRKESFLEIPENNIQVCLIQYEKEDMIYGIEDKAVFHEVMEAIHKTATDKAIVEMCGHAVYTGRKNG